VRNLLDFLRLAAAYVRLNLNAQLEYRGAFYSQVLAMFLNNTVWVVFWVLFFTRFPVLRGWTREDVLTLWGLTAAGFGLAHAVFGNGLSLAGLIAQGSLDAWMLYPRTLLPHLLLGRMSASSVGDALFGYAVYLVMVRPDLPHLLLFVALTVSVAVLFIAFSVLTGSLAFFLGSSAALSEQWRFALVTFGTYPSAIFEGAVKLVLYTLIPAAFINALPIEALRNLNLMDALLAVAGSLAALLAAVLTFQAGLRRYESGNLMEMRG
jgi:ABC-2 type transport system permease protein